eukprot:TRINITY_DN29506_c0_g1_i1.p1 TRINITY_DN29506_c0_g1~~TRINITY_DN29506_c0_g1_i1.p1  ORF type:complete len:429 (-),score=79.58 TRINITY_DN29506_c0_g1_i1:91-1377(-)
MAAGNATTEVAALTTGAAIAANTDDYGQRFEKQRLLLDRQQAQIDSLREEFETVSKCLVSKGLLSSEALLAQLHRLRFEKVRGAHPLCSQVSFIESLATRELAIAVARSVGASGMRVLCTVSQAARSAADAAALPEEVWSGNVFVCGGYDGASYLSRVDYFDPRVGGGTWKTLPPMLGRREGAAAAVIDGNLFVCGGFDGVHRLRAAERLDPLTGSWHQLPPMDARRGGAAAGVLHGKLYVCGGFDGGQYLNSVECFAPDGAVWTSAPRLAVAREGATAGVLGEYLYVCGGNNGTETLDTVERMFRRRRIDYVWEQVSSMAVRRDGPSAAAVRGKLYVCGGFDGAQSLSLRSSERYDPASNSWRSLRPMLARRAGAAAAVVAGHIYVCGGYDGAQNLFECERLDPAEGMWELLPQMPCRRGYAAGAAS